MTQLLVSVRSAEEARAALRGGADWIDLKEPRRGPLGAVEAMVAREVVNVVGGRAPISAAGGELIDWPRATSRALVDVEGITHFKLGLADCGDIDWRSRLCAAQDELHEAGKELVAAIYADYSSARSPCPSDVVEQACQTPGGWVLFDTFDKSAGALSDVFDRLILVDLLRTLRETGKCAAVAGRLNRDAIAALPLELIDMVAVRGAACDGDRHGTVRAERVAALRASLRRESPNSSDYIANFSVPQEFA
jgi:(5-formylfuran-3-yl)methyl phosphate synthase